MEYWIVEKDDFIPNRPGGVHAEIKVLEGPFTDKKEADKKANEHTQREMKRRGVTLVADCQYRYMVYSREGIAKARNMGTQIRNDWILGE